MAARSILLLLWAAQPATMVSGSLLLSLLSFAVAAGQAPALVTVESGGAVRVRAGAMLDIGATAGSTGPAANAFPDPPAPPRAPPTSPPPVMPPITPPPTSPSPAMPPPAPPTSPPPSTPPPQYQCTFADWQREYQCNCCRQMLVQNGPDWSGAEGCAVGCVYRGSPAGCGNQVKCDCDSGHCG